jgi:hypothetical protein
VAKGGAMANRRAPLVVLLAACLGVAGCGGEDAPAPLAPVGGLEGSLIERSRPVAGGLVEWHIDWRLCWNPYPDAVYYELRTFTSEGVSPELRRHDERCRTISVAGKTSKPAERANDRLLLLGFQRGSVSYAVRAVLPDGRRSPWSPAADVAAEGSIGDVSRPPS